MTDPVVESVSEEQNSGHDGRPPGSTPVPAAPAPAPPLVSPAPAAPASMAATQRVAASTADSAAGGSPDWLIRDLGQIVAPDRVLSRPIELVMYASDASFYRLVPQAVVLSESVEEIRQLFAYSHRRRIPITFRAAGTSLSGQAQGDGILVEVARHWRGVTVENEGRRVRVKPGTIAARVNLALRPYAAKLGPDPASIATCTVGGVVNNNSSGMCCGVEQNAYRTVRSLTFVLPSGTVIDSAAPDAASQFAAAEPELAAGLTAIREQLLADAMLSERIRRKYARKNTTGYGLNAFLDYSDPLDIFIHLLIGSEGTLAFLAEVVFDTVPELPHRITGLLVFPDVHAAGAAVAGLRDAGATAVELMDRPSLRAVEDKRGVPAYLRGLPDGAAGLLVDFATADPDRLAGLESVAAELVNSLELVVPAEFTRDRGLQVQYWAVRGGLFTSVGAARASGTSVLLEDVTFPVERLADAVVDLTRLFTEHGYAEGVIFGHAKDGNLHFLLTQSLNEPAEIERYARFMDAMVELVIDRYDGALKAEHGTGRNMAPFVEREWGAAAAEIMRTVKRLADPEGLLNPGTIINSDPRAHLAHLKTTPTIEAVADRCIECGYCEPVCPSRDLTTTPRQRIVIRREMVRQSLASPDGRETPMLHALRRDYDYQGLQTCAGDSMCERACPVDIDTGALVKVFRASGHSPRATSVAVLVARRYAAVERLARLGIRTGRAAGKVLGHRSVVGLTELFRAATSADLVPSWDPDMPPPAPGRLPWTDRDGAAAVYLPACINRIFGPDGGRDGGPTLPESLVALAARAGRPVVIPAGVAGMCCGMPWQSKGYADGTAVMVNRTVQRLWDWSDHGRLPIVIDASSCTQSLRTCGAYLTAENADHLTRLALLDSIDFAHDVLLPRLSVGRKHASVAIHAVCSVHHAEAVGKLDALAAAVSDRVVNPVEAGCCGFAGDRGWLHPELTASALAPEAAALAGSKHGDYLSSNRTCEVGLTREIGRPYRSFVYALEEATRQMEQPSPVY